MTIPETYSSGFLSWEEKVGRGKEGQGIFCTSPPQRPVPMDDTWFVLRRAPDWDPTSRFFVLKSLDSSLKLPELLVTQQDADWYLGAVRLVGVGDELQLKGADVARVRVGASTHDGDSAASGDDDEPDASAVRVVVSNWKEARVRQRRVDAAVEVAAGEATARLTAAGGAGVDTPLARLKASLARVGLPLGSRVVFASVTVLCVPEQDPCIVAAEQVAFHAVLRRTADAMGLHAAPLGPRMLLPAAAPAEAVPVIVPPPSCPVAAGDVLMIAAGAEVKPPWGGLPASVPYTVDARAAAVGIFTGFSVASVQGKGSEKIVVLRRRRLCARQRVPGGSLPAEVTLLRSELHELFPKLAAGRDAWVASCDEVWFRTLRLLRGGSAAESGVAAAPRIDAGCSRGAWFVQRETGLVVGAGDGSQQPPPVAAALAFAVHRVGFSDDGGAVQAGREVCLRHLSHDFAVRTTVAELARMPRAAAFAGDICDAVRLGATVVFTRFRASGENDSGAGERRCLVTKSCELSAVLPPAPEAAPALPGDDEEAAVVVPDDMELRAFLQQPSTDHVVKLTYLFLVTASVVATGSSKGERWYVMEVQPSSFSFRLSEGVPGFSEDEPNLLKYVADAVDSPASIVTISFRTLAVCSEEEAPAAVAECAVREVAVHACVHGVRGDVRDVHPVAPAGAATALPHAVAVCGMLAPPSDGDGGDGGGVDLGEACGLAFAALAQLLSVAAAREAGLAAMSDADFCHVCDCLGAVGPVVERLRVGGAVAARAAARGAREALAKLAHVVRDAFEKTCGGGGGGEERTRRLHTLNSKGLRLLALSGGGGGGRGGGDGGGSSAEAALREEACRQAKREGRRGKDAAWKEVRDAREARNRARAQEVGMPFAPEQIRVTTKEAPDEFIEAFARAKAEAEAGEGVRKKRYPGDDGGLGSKIDFMMRYKSTEEWDEAP